MASETNHSGAYSAVHKIYTRNVALKVPNNSSGWLRELAILNQTQHPAIVSCSRYSVYDWNRDAINFNNIAGPAACILELPLAKYDCHNLITTSSSPLSWEHLQSIIFDIFCGLAYLHKHGIKHLDLKPSNILIYAAQPRWGMMCRIADFGLSVHNGCHINKSIICTVHYRPPEVELQGLVDTACDIWSAGCIIYELCCQLPIVSAHYYRGNTVLATAYHDLFAAYHDYPERVNFWLSKLKSNWKISAPGDQKDKQQLLIAQLLAHCLVANHQQRKSANQIIEIGMQANHIWYESQWLERISEYHQKEKFNLDQDIKTFITAEQLKFVNLLLAYNPLKDDNLLFSTSLALKLIQKVPTEANIPPYIDIMVCYNICYVYFRNDHNLDYFIELLKFTGSYLINCYNIYEQYYQYCNRLVIDLLKAWRGIVYSNHLYNNLDESYRYHSYHVEIWQNTLQFIHNYPNCHDRLNDTYSVLRYIHEPVQKITELTANF